MEKIELMNYYTGCKIIYTHYGKENQRKQLVQELAELIVAITKGDLENIIEEMADVQVMFDQVMIDNPEMHDKLSMVMMSKVKRQLQRIEQEKANARKEKQQ